MSEYGWICPKCNKVHAPWVSECDCNKPSQTYTTNSSTENCQHSWIPIAGGTGGTIYLCEFCGKISQAAESTMTTISSEK